MAPTLLPRIPSLLTPPSSPSRRARLARPYSAAQYTAGGWTRKRSATTPRGNHSRLGRDRRLPTGPGSRGAPDCHGGARRLVSGVSLRKRSRRHRKGLCYRESLEQRHARKLENRAQAGLEGEPFLEDGDEPAHGSRRSLAGSTGRQLGISCPTGDFWVAEMGWVDPEEVHAYGTTPPGCCRLPLPPCKAFWQPADSFARFAWRHWTISWRPVDARG